MGQTAHDTLAATSPGHNEASPIQQIYVFQDADAARKAFAAVLSASAKCLVPAGTDQYAAGIHQTTGTTNSASWVSYPKAGGRVLIEGHDYAVQEGRTITFFNISLSASSAKPIPGYLNVSDSTVIADLERHLSIFGTG